MGKALQKASLDGIDAWTRHNNRNSLSCVHRRSDRVARADVRGEFALEACDGRVLNYAKDVGSRVEIWQMPVDGGTETPLVSTPTSWTFAVARDGLYFVNYASTALTPSIDFLEFTTGKRSPIIKLDKPAWMGLAVSPDGKYLLYTVQDSIKGNLMLVDNLQ